MPPPADGFAVRLVRGPALRTQPDRRLVTLVREGYEAAFEEIVRRYGKALTRYAAAIVGSRGEDVTQDAFSKALLALRRDDDSEIELRPWLFRIVRNTALNDLRDSPPTPELLAEAIAGGSNPAEEIERREELTDLMQRLQSLPERQRAAIVMRELEGLSHEEIATALGLSGGAARQAIFRARQALRDGFGMLLPLPLLRLLVDHGGEMAAAGTGGAAAASGALGGASAGVALKAATTTVLVAGAIGAGVAVQQDRHNDRALAAPEPVAQSAVAAGAANQGAAPSASTGGGSPSGPTDDQSGPGHHGNGESEQGEDRGRDRGSSGGTGRGGGSGHDSFAQEPGDDHGGGGSGGDVHHGGHSGAEDHSGGGGPGPSGEDGGGHSGSRSSGHGGGGGSDDGSPSIDEPAEGGSSGPGSGGSLDSGGGSGSGSGSGLEPEGDSSGGSGSGDHGGDSGSRGDGSGSGPGTSGGGSGSEQLP